MEYVEGETLAQRLRQGPLAVREAVRAAIELLGVLSAMHGRGMIHRDLKPANIMMTADGVRLIDFGLAVRETVARSEETVTVDLTSDSQLLCGTPGYIAPEQVRGDRATPLSDLFAMGAILFEMIAAAPAFPGTSLGERLAAVLHVSPPSLPAMPETPELDGLIRRALAKTPSARFASAAEFADELRLALEPRSPETSETAFEDRREEPAVKRGLRRAHLGLPVLRAAGRVNPSPSDGPALGPHRRHQRHPHLLS